MRRLLNLQRLRVHSRQDCPLLAGHLLLTQPLERLCTRALLPEGCIDGALGFCELGDCCWGTSEPLPCQHHLQYVFAIGTPGIIWGTRVERSAVRNVPARRVTSPAVEEIIDLGESHGNDDITELQRAHLLLRALVEHSAGVTTERDGSCCSANPAPAHRTMSDDRIAHQNRK